MDKRCLMMQFIQQNQSVLKYSFVDHLWEKKESSIIIEQIFSIERLYVRQSHNLLDNSLTAI